VPLEQPDRQHCETAAGYLELGMFLEANTELDEIDPFNRAAPEVLALRIAIYRELEQWELMQDIAKRLVDFQPDEIQWTISLAYAARRAVSIERAKELLLNAEATFPKEAAIKYNLACYFCKTKDIQKAKSYLKKAFAIDLRWRMTALEDEDLKALWNSI